MLVHVCVISSVFPASQETHVDMTCERTRLVVAYATGAICAASVAWLATLAVILYTTCIMRSVASYKV